MDAIFVWVSEEYNFVPLRACAVWWVFEGAGKRLRRINKSLEVKILFISSNPLKGINRTRPNWHLIFYLFNLQMRQCPLSPRCSRRYKDRGCGVRRRGPCLKIGWWYCSDNNVALRLVDDISDVHYWIQCCWCICLLSAPVLSNTSKILRCICSARQDIVKSFGQFSTDYSNLVLYVLAQ
jgi:hypothetical protein